MFKSSRFIAFCVGVILFTSMVFLTPYSPLEIASAISIIAGIYIVPKTVRGYSAPKE